MARETSEELADFDMLCCMIDENNTQQQITPKIVFENVIAALTLAERFLRSTENVDEFNNLLKSSSSSLEDGRNSWLPHHYAAAKNAIAETGDGLGKDVVKHFLPRHAVPTNDTLQTAITTYSQETGIIFTSSLRAVLPDPSSAFGR